MKTFYDYFAHYTDRVGDWLSRPFFRMSAWATARWRELDKRDRLGT